MHVEIRGETRMSNSLTNLTCSYVLCLNKYFCHAYLGTLALLNELGMHKIGVYHDVFSKMYL